MLFRSCEMTAWELAHPANQAETRYQAIGIGRPTRSRASRRGLRRYSPDAEGEPMSAIESEAVSKVLTIDEAAAILRISRNSAYAAARRWRTTGGRPGLPCNEIGRILRVPRADLDRPPGRAAGPDAPLTHGRPTPPPDQKQAGGG